MYQVQILVPCSYCQGKAYLPDSEATDGNGCTYKRHVSCPICKGTGNSPKWISLGEFATILRQAICTHQHTSFSGGLYFSGEPWDDIKETRDEYGAKLEGQTLVDFIRDRKERRFTMLFYPGKIVPTPGTLELSEQGLNLLAYLKCHLNGDWGDLCPNDKAENEVSVQNGFRLLSAWHLVLVSVDHPRSRSQRHYLLAARWVLEGFDGTPTHPRTDQSRQPSARVSKPSPGRGSFRKVHHDGLPHQATGYGIRHPPIIDPGPAVQYPGRQMESALTF